MIPTRSLFNGAPGSATPDAPLEHLRACHRRIEQHLETLERAAAALDTRRGEALAAFESAFHFLNTSGALHTADEEESLFPRLMPLLEIGERSYLAGLEHGHTEAHRMYSALKELVRAPQHDPAWTARVRDLAARLAAHYRLHIASEDESLQDYAARLLTQQQLAAIGAEMKARRKPAEDTRSADRPPDSRP